ETKQTNGKVDATLKHSGQLGPRLKLDKVETKGDSVVVAVNVQGTSGVFEGTAGKDPARVLGSINIDGQIIPASLVKTEDSTITPKPPDRAFLQKLGSAIQNPDPKDKIKQLQEAIGDHPDPKLAPAQEELLKARLAAGQPAKDIKADADRWLEASRP